MTCCVTGTTGSEDPDVAPIGFFVDALDALKSLAATVLLFIGGMRLRRLRASGARIIRIALWIAIVAGSAFFAAEMAISMVAKSDPEMPLALILIALGYALVALCEFAFMILALVWLTKYERELPLIAGT